MNICWVILWNLWSCCMRHPFMKASLLCSPSIDAFNFSLDVSYTLLHVISYLTVYAKEKSNDNKDWHESFKLLWMHKIMTPIANWLFERHKTVLLEYFGVHSLISFKVHAQFWFTDSFPWILRRGKFAMGDFCDSHRSIADHVVKMCLCRNSWSHLSQIAFIADRRSHIAASQIALSHSIIVCCLCDVTICDVAYRSSEIS